MGKADRKLGRRVAPLSIASALDAFAPLDEAALCAFVNRMERARKEGDVLSWSLAAMPGGGFACAALDGGGDLLESAGATVTEAVKSFSVKLIEAAMQGAPEA